MLPTLSNKTKPRVHKRDFPHGQTKGLHLTNHHNFRLCYNVVSKKFASVLRVIRGWSALGHECWSISEAACLIGFLFRLPPRGLTDPSKNSSSCEIWRPESETENRDSGPDDSIDRAFGLRATSPFKWQFCLEKEEFSFSSLRSPFTWSLITRKVNSSCLRFRCGL